MIGGISIVQYDKITMVQWHGAMSAATSCLKHGRSSKARHGSGSFVTMSSQVLPLTNGDPDDWRPSVRQFELR